MTRLLAALVLTLAALAPAAAAGAPLKAVLLVPQDDERLDRTRLERAYLGHPGGPAEEGLKLAFEDAGFELDAAGTAIEATTREVASKAGAGEAAQAAEQGGAAVLIVDLPADWALAVADAVKLPVLNISARDDRLRASDCRPRLWHVVPSDRMRSDALAQYLASRKWRDVLLLVGPGPRDASRAAAAEASIKRYGLKLVQRRPYKLSADPRERDLGNTLLLTRGAYDVVWVVDSDGEFARSVPYHTVLPRPVVGDAGLVPLAWHASFERYGAPQVVRRFAKANERPMTAHDWAAWTAGKFLVAAATAAPKGPAAAWAKALAAAEVDGSKGTALTFRVWDGQLRQPMLLTDGQGVIAKAPLEGMLHPSNVLDTLGNDAPEKLCKLAR